jgi:general secretion pathway protein G
LNKKSFSLIEIIFVIILISIISIVALPKIFNNISQANIVKLKSDIALIRHSIKKYITNEIINNTNNILTNLDIDNTLLFKIILDQPIVSKQNSVGRWSKISSLQYQAWVTNDIFVLFIYNIDEGTFDCDINDNYCRDLTQ